MELVDLRDYPLPFFDQKPPAVTGRNYPTEEIARLGRKLDEADAFVILTGEYNHGYPAVLKNAIDHTFVEWRRKPVAFVGWGGVGGARAIEQLRLVAVELEMVPICQWKHAEAIGRLEALWRAWEFLRVDGTTGMSVWWRDHADHHMSVLLSADGPFKGCTPDDGHRTKLTPLPCEEPPPGLF